MLLCPWDSSGKDIQVGCQFLLQGIFLTHGLNPHLLHWQAVSLPLSHQGSLIQNIQKYRVFYPECFRLNDTYYACSMQLSVVSHHGENDENVHLFSTVPRTRGFPGGAGVKNPPDTGGDPRDTGSIPGSGRSPGGGNGNPLQCSCLENPMDTGTRRATVHGVTKELNMT